MAKNQSKTSRPSIKNKNTAKIKTQDDYIDTKVKISGQSVKFQDISPTGINKISETKKEAEKLVEENDQESEEETQGEKNINQIKEKITQENQQEKVENKAVDDYIPEVLSAAGSEIDYKKPSSTIWIIFLVAVVIGLIIVIGYWYWDEYGLPFLNLSKNEVKSSQTSQSGGTISSNSPNSQSEIDNKIAEIESKILQNDNNPLTEKPEIDFDVNF